ncbi:MAG TPA: 50S ribosomal protein L10 [Flavobacteriales bacterium]|nr:50S ribosomal protein L10 [Flavobacteriales bacterium]
MTREEKTIAIENLKEIVTSNNVIYLSDISGIDAETTSKLRRLCHSKGIKLQVVKNTMLKKALESSEKDFEPFYVALKGNTSIMIAEAANGPAQIIKEFRKKQKRPILKGAFINESFYIGDEHLEVLSTLKSREELLGEIIALLQSPAKNVVASLQSGKHTIAGLVKALGERKN